jgi:hypothetical protein
MGLEPEMTDRPFASAILAQAIPTSDVLAINLQLAFENSLEAILYSNPADGITGRIGHMSARNGTDLRPWVASVLYKTPGSMKSISIEPRKEYSGRLEQQFKRLFEKAYELGVWNIRVAKNDAATAPSAHELITYSIEAEKWN